MAGMIKLLAVVVGLLFLVPDTMQLPINHPIHAVVQRLTADAGSYLGLVISTSADESLLTNSTDYEPNLSVPYIVFAGRTFTFGTFKNEPVIHVLAGKPSANVAATVQMLIDLFPIKGIINYGSAATVSDQVSLADVVIPSQVAFAGVWSWEEPEARVRYPSLKIGEYNLPEAGGNSLGHITSLKTQVYKPTGSSRTYFIDVHSEWLQLAARLNFGESPSVRIGEGYRGGSSDIYMLNSAYGTYLNKKLNITIVDTARKCCRCCDSNIKWSASHCDQRSIKQAWNGTQQEIIRSDQGKRSKNSFSVHWKPVRAVPKDKRRSLLICCAVYVMLNCRCCCCSWFYVSLVV
ncbi:bark storage protein A-like isoform X1 [Silene latifolia]|uniref:bark storage protein A-like isoform X1 n=1 Tax=Silene latifolia TaxID=37657 RepID=UPI003D77DCD4